MQKIVGQDVKGSRVLVTGAAGFIGFHLVRQLCESGAEVLGYDNVNDYYYISLKEARLKELEELENFTFIKADLEDQEAMEQAFADFQPVFVIHLAAQAGVRYSIDQPRAYLNSNLVGFLNILECCRHNKIKHLVFASSSSVYGANTKMPFSESDKVDHPVSLYGATKKSNELMAHSYAHLYDIPCTGLRFFTVYGPWGRPDMAYFKFANKIMQGEAIDVYNHGDMKRDFTYIDDIVDGIIRSTEHIPSGNDTSGVDKGEADKNNAPCRIYNIGNNNPENLMDMIGYLEEALGKKAEVNMLPMQAGDVPSTYANIDTLSSDTGYKPTTDLKTGLKKFAVWYSEFYR